MISIGHNINNRYAQYGLEHFLFKYGIKAKVDQVENADIEINYGSSTNSRGGATIQILSNEIKPDIAGYLLSTNEKVPLFEMPKKLNVKAENKVLATFQSDRDTYPCVTGNDTGLLIGFDIFGEIGHILSGHLEPIFWKQRDESKRLMRIPVVDILEDFLFDWLHSLLSGRGIPLKAKPFWPDGKKFALVLTHDVDRIYKTYQYAPSVLKRIQKRDFSGLTSEIKSFLFKHGKGNPYWNFDRIMDLETKLGVKSTFFFLNESGKLNPFSFRSWILFKGVYKIDDPNIIEAIQKLHRNGFEIGVHGSYNSYNNIQLLKAEKEILESIIGDKVHGVRQHYLNFDPEDTLEIQESAGFEYDSTLGFKPQVGIGFRSGTCFPFHPLLPNGFQASLLEIPFIIMDGALQPETALSDCIQVMEEVERHQGALTLLWHQRVFNEREFPSMTVLYEQLVEKGHREDAWITNAHGLYQWLAYEREGIDNAAEPEMSTPVGTQNGEY